MAKEKAALIKLVIVESPAKARKIGGYLGDDYVVEASVGHIRDLPQRAADIPKEYKKIAWAKEGVDIENDFAPLYVINPDKKAKVAELCLGQSAARTAQELVVFVTRPDKWKQRKDWHLAQVQKEINGEPTKAQKMMLQYYGKVMPLLYTADPLRIMAVLRITISFFGGLFKPFYRTGGAAAKE